MRERNIALIGFRATGKTSAGKILADRLGRLFIDMDKHLIATSGREISCWVRQEGWESFRKAESELLASLASQEGIVVSTGGGVVIDSANRDTLKKRFFTIWLKASAETIHCRITADPESCTTRPPLSGLSLKEEVRKILSDREPLYAESADFEVDTEGKGIDEIVEEVLERVNSEE